MRVCRGRVRDFCCFDQAAKIKISPREEVGTYAYWQSEVV